MEERAPGEKEEGSKGPTGGWGVVKKAVVSDKDSGPGRPVSTLIHCGSLGELGNLSKPQFTDLENGGTGLKALGLQAKLRDGSKAHWS